MIGGTGDGVQVAMRDHAVGRFVNDGRRVGGAFELVMFLDEQPVGLGLLRSFAAHADQRPVALQLVAVQDKFETAGAEAFIRIAHRLPGPGVPQHHGAAAVLSLGDGALEAAIFHGVVFDLDGEPLVRDDVAWPLGNSPAFEHAIPAQAEVVMQARRGVLLDDERQTLGWRLCLGGAAGFCGGGEVAHLAIAGELCVHRGGGTLCLLRGLLRACGHQAALRRRVLDFACPPAACAA